MTIEPSVSAAILAARTGYGKHVTGGAAGEIYEMTNLNDSGPGSLRYACGASDPLWVVPALGLTGSIVVPSDIYVKDNKTLDLPGITLSAAGPDIDVLRLQGVSNIIINRVGFDGCNLKWDGDDALGGDLIKLRGAADIYVRRCSFTRPHDGAIDSSHLSQRITIQECRFSNAWQAVNLTADKVTFIRNYGINIRRRFPQVVAAAGKTGFIHSVNNVLHPAWNDRAILSAKADAGQSGKAYLLSDSCVWKSKGFNDAGEASANAMLQIEKPLKENAVDLFPAGSVPQAMRQEARALVNISKPTTAAGIAALVALISAAAGSLN